MEKKLVLSLLIFIQFNLSSSELIILLTIPKCGTNMLIKLTKLLTNKSVHHELQYDSLSKISEIKRLSSEFCFYSHLRHLKDVPNKFNRLNGKNIFIIRDPRDQLVSFTFYAYKEWKQRNDLFKKILENPFEYKGKIPNYGAYIHQNVDTLMFNLIVDGSEIYDGYSPYVNKTKGINAFFNSYLKWIDHKNICFVKFENLVGPKGGGSLEKQIKEIKKIAKHLGFNLSSAQANQLGEDLFGGTRTFREGQIGSWKKYFKRQHKEAFKKYAGDLLIKLGYEKDYNW